MTKASSVKTRFCPSPTGELHIGSARTAFFNWLLAKKMGGSFILRIEDTDLSRSSSAYTQHMMRDMRWLGLEWDEGPEVGGDQGPYYQSERQSLYEGYYQQLEQQDQAYPCFCTEQDLQVARKAQLAAGRPPRYPGTCRRLSQSEINAKLNQGLKPTLRFKVPDSEPIVFHDLVHGRQRFQSEDIGDFIIRRADGTPPFMFSNAVDDALMGVTHALRGDDHITNTPRQLLILEALGLPAPQYAHIALIVGGEGSPLSKRLGSLGVANLREAGYLPNALLNYLSRLGHTYPDDHWHTQQALAAGFSTERLNAAPARFDEQQLRFWQRQAMHHCELQTLWPLMKPYVAAYVPKAMEQAFLETVQPNIDFPQDAEFWAKTLFHEVTYSEEAGHWVQQAGSEFFQAAILAVQRQGADYQALTQHLKSHCQVKGKQLFKPLRAALTGTLQGPELNKVVEILGADSVIDRFEKAKGG